MQLAQNAFSLLASVSCVCFCQPSPSKSHQSGWSLVACVFPGKIICFHLYGFYNQCFFNISYFFEVIFVKTRAIFFRPSFLQSLQLAPSCNKQVWDMGVRESPLPRTNAMFNLGWFGTQTGWYVLFEVNPNTINGTCVYREGAVSKADCSFKFTCAVVDWKVMHGKLHWDARITRCSIGQKDRLLSIWTARDELRNHWIPIFETFSNVASRACYKLHDECEQRSIKSVLQVTWWMRAT